jgi:ATP-dependent DNA ligase
MSRKGIMLCYPFEEKRLTKWGPGPHFSQPKLDGRRVRAIFDSKGKVTLLSSEENILTKYQHINKALEETHYINLELDGELYVHGLSFEQICSDDYASQMQYHIFDMPMQSRPQYMRFIGLKALFPRDTDFIKRVPIFEVSSLDSVMFLYDEFLDEGYEGFVLRHHNSLYLRDNFSTTITNENAKRSTLLMKFKPKKEDIYRIAGYSQEVDKYNNPKPNWLGRLICNSEEGDTRNLGLYPPKPARIPEGFFGIGSGFKDIDSIQLWKIREDLPGKYVKVKYQHISDTGRVPRFPVYMEIYDPTK